MCTQVLDDHPQPNTIHSIGLDWIGARLQRAFEYSRHVPQVGFGKSADSPHGRQSVGGIDLDAHHAFESRKLLRASRQHLRLGSVVQHDKVVAWQLEQAR